MKNVECNAKEMVVALVAKTILEPQNGVLTPFKSATNLRQTQKACRKNFFTSCVQNSKELYQQVRYQ